jgi:hypothetical protein
MQLSKRESRGDIKPSGGSDTTQQMGHFVHSRMTAVRLIQVNRQVDAIKQNVPRNDVFGEA